jgi:gamma-glutamylputrescine oxidase
MCSGNAEVCWEPGKLSGPSYPQEPRQGYACWDSTGSFWLAEAYTPNSPLTGRLQADIAIVGGGITGLSSAYHCKRRYPDKHIVLLEGQAIGFGASGRNSGFISQEYHGWDRLFEQKGAAAVEPYARYAERGYQLLVHTIRDEAIACDLQERGAVRLAKTAAEVRVLERQTSTYPQLGRAVQLWQGADLAARIKTDFYPAGLFLPHWSLLHPGKLMRGLKTVVERLGVVVYEQTPVHRLHHRRPVEIVCQTGQVQASTVIVATNAYTPKLGLLKSFLMPLHLYVVVTEPLAAQERAQDGWDAVPGRFEMDATHTTRLTPDGRLFMRGGARYDYDNGIVYRHAPQAYQHLSQRLQARYPQLGKVRPAYTWSGMMALTRAHTPLLGRMDADATLLYSVGYNGFGLVSGFHGGKLLCDLYANEPNEDLSLMASPDRTGWLLPEPLRYVHMNIALMRRGHRLR